MELNEEALNAIADRVVSKLLSASFDRILGTTSLKTLDIRRFAQFACAMSSAEFYNRYLYNTQFFPNYVDHVAEMARRAKALGDGGLFLEFGVASGLTIRAIASAAQTQVYGFDSFAGLPEDWREGVGKGAFAFQVPELPSNVTLEIGMIEQTLPKFLARMKPERVSFIHIDTDLYGPAEFILFCLAPCIKDTYVVFDEFYNYPGYEDHEFRAFREFQEHYAHEFEVTFTGCGGTAAVSARITRR